MKNIHMSCITAKLLINEKTEHAMFRWGERSSQFREAMLSVTFTLSLSTVPVIITKLHESIECNCLRWLFRTQDIILMITYQVWGLSQYWASAKNPS